MNARSVHTLGAVATLLAVGLPALAGCNEVVDMIFKKRDDVFLMEQRLKGRKSWLNPGDRDFVSASGHVARLAPAWYKVDPARPARVNTLFEAMYNSYNSGDMQAVAARAREIIQADPATVEPMLMEIIAHSWMNTHSRLLDEYLKAAEGPPPNAARHAALGRLYAELGHPDEALAHIRTAQRLEPNMTYLHAIAGYHYATYQPRRDLTLAIAELRAEINASRVPGPFLTLEHWYRTEFDDPIAAVKVFEDYQRDYPLKGMLCRFFALDLASAGEKDLVGSIVPRCFKESAGDSAEYNDLGLAYLDAGLWEVARAHYLEGTRRYGGAFSHLGMLLKANLGRALVELNRPEEAQEALEESTAYRAMPYNSYYLGMARLMRGMNIQAGEDFARCVKLDRGKELLNARYFKHIIGKDIGRRFTGDEVLRIHRHDRPRTVADRLAKAGSGYTRWGAFDEAERRINEALALEPDNGMAHAGMVSLSRFRGENDRAIGIGERAVARGITHTNLYNDLGYAYKVKGDFEKAETLYRKALALNPLNWQAHANLAVVLEESGRAREADEHWELSNKDLGWIYDPLGPYKQYATGMIAILIGLWIAIRVRRRSKAGKPSAPGAAGTPTRED